MKTAPRDGPIYWEHVLVGRVVTSHRRLYTRVGAARCHVRKCSQKKKCFYSTYLTRYLWHSLCPWEYLKTFMISISINIQKYNRCTVIRIISNVFYLIKRSCRGRFTNLFAIHYKFGTDLPLLQSACTFLANFEQLLSSELMPEILNGLILFLNVFLVK